MRRILLQSGNWLLFLSLWCTLFAPAQTPTSPPPMSNADIVKLIQAGLPEAAIINKIRANESSFDTSTEALIALKKAGATDAELAAITAVPIFAPSKPATAAMPTIPVQPMAPAQPVEVFGAHLLRTKAGDPYLQFPSTKSEVFPDGSVSNTARLVIFEGELAILIPSTNGAQGGSVGNLLFMKGHALFDWYIDGATARDVHTPREDVDLLRKGDRERAKTDPEFLSKKKTELYPVILPLTFKAPSGYAGRPMFAYPPGPTGGGLVGFRIGVYGIWGPNGPPDDPPLRSAQLQLFVSDLQKDFDSTLSVFERAASISDPIAQLSPAAHYQVISEELSQRYKVLLAQRFAEMSAGGTNWLALLNELNDVRQLGSGLKGMGSGLTSGSGSAFAAGLQNVTSASNAMAATDAQARYAAEVQSSAVAAQNYAAVQTYPSAAAASSGTSQAGQASATGAPVQSATTIEEPWGPTSIVFAGWPNNPTLIGHAHVVSDPPGIDCPGVCTYTFPYHQALTLTAAADRSSVVERVEGTCPSSGSSLPTPPGNTYGCFNPLGYVGIVRVDVYPYPVPTVPAITGSGAKPKAPPPPTSYPTVNPK